MTVAEAIYHKSIIEIQKEIIRNIGLKLQFYTGELNKSNEKVNEQALANVKQLLNKTDSSNIAEDKKAVEMINTYTDNYGFQLADPLKAEKLIEKMDKEVSEFESEVDSVLSESNATTFIEI